MSKRYVPRWMTGADALESLTEIENDLRKRFALLQSAIRDGEVRARARGRDRDRQWFADRLGLSPDDFMKEVDGPWRNTFINPGPDAVDVAAFGVESEILREDVDRCFPPEQRSSGEQSAVATMAGSQAKEVSAKSEVAAVETGSTIRNLQRVPNKTINSVRGYSAADVPLIDEMHNIIEREHISVWAAAKRLAHRASGKGSPEKKIERLTKRYKSQWGRVGGNSGC